MSWRQRLDPRLHLAAAIAWAVFGVVTLAAALGAGLAAVEAERRARAEAQAQLAEFATQVRDALSIQIETRRALLQATAAQLAATPALPIAEAARTLVAAYRQFPEFVWLGMADTGGRLRAQLGERDGGDDVSQQRWFQQGRDAALVTDRRVDGGPPLPDRGQPVYVAAPMQRGDGSLAGVLGAHLDWAWVEAELAKMQGVLNRSRRIELVLLSRGGQVLLGPEPWRHRQQVQPQDLAEGTAYLVGSRQQLRLANDLGLGWTVVVRQPAATALAPARTAARTVFLVVFASGLLSAAAAAAVTSLLTRRLSRLAQDAEAVRQGRQRNLATPSGADEVARIGATLVDVVGRLQTDKQALEQLNLELDQRVAERASRIERMAQEARYAAVTRERLRLARDLHDTLAHSLMALLTQIRLVRKLGARLSASELDVELGHAEAVASSGVVDARAAILQMRDNGVRDTGLGPALQDLCARFGRRTGLTVALQLDAALATAADERSETLFRILEEALRNVERHAAATEVRLQLQRNEGPPATLQVEVVDNGVGFDPAQPRPGHYGLRGMQEQAVLIHAALALHSQPGQGTRVTVQMAL